MSERYIVRESSGYTQGRPVWWTEVLVLDSWYGYAVTWSSRSSVQRTNHWRWATARKWSLKRKQEYAAQLAAELNAEHEAAMLAPMQAATVGEDAQAREGKAI